MDDRRHVQIIIAGLPGSGKTTVKEVIEKALRDAHLNVTSVVDPNAENENRKQTWRYVEKMNSAGHTVGIQVRQIRSPINE